MLGLKNKLIIKSKIKKVRIYKNLGLISLSSLYLRKDLIKIILRFYLVFYLSLINIRKSLSYSINNYIKLINKIVITLT